MFQYLKIAMLFLMEWEKFLVEEGWNSSVKKIKQAPV